jgi:hypothetical protein
MYRLLSLEVALTGALTWATGAHWQLIISEIMYNPASDESPPNAVEWVEITNVSNEEVDLSGWRLADEDAPSGRIAEGVTLGAGAVLVLIPDILTPADFHAAWGPDIPVLPLSNWGRPLQFNLANNPSQDNEQLRLERANASVADEVNYDNTGDWPPSRPSGPSIYLLPGHFDAAANDAGAAWARSEPGGHGAWTNEITEVFNGRDIGSPGGAVRQTARDDAP